jgi:mRNA interferase MazF
MKIIKGEIYLVDLGDNSRGSEQKGIRPCVILQNNIGNRFSTTTICGLLTTKEKKNKKKKHFPMHVPIQKLAIEKNGLQSDSLLLCEQVFTISKDRLIKRLGVITPTSPLMKQIDEALKISFGIQ